MESGNAPVGSAPPPAPAAKPPRSKFFRWTMGIIGAVVVVIGAAQVYSAIQSFFTLPACDSQRAKDSLSGAFKEHKFEPLRYETIQTISTSPDEVVCNAVLPLPDGVNLVADYTFFWQDKSARIKYTLRRRAP